MYTYHLILADVERYYKQYINYCFILPVAAPRCQTRFPKSSLQTYLSKKPNTDTESDIAESSNDDHDISEGDSRQKTLFNDIGDSFKQFISFLEDSNAHDI